MTWLGKLLKRKWGEVNVAEAAEIRANAAYELARARERAERAKEAVSRSREIRLAYFTDAVQRALRGDHG